MWHAARERTRAPRTLHTPGPTRAAQLASAAITGHPALLTCTWLRTYATMSCSELLTDPRCSSRMRLNSASVYCSCAGPRRKACTYVGKNDALELSRSPAAVHHTSCRGDWSLASNKGHGKFHIATVGASWCVLFAQAVVRIPESCPRIPAGTAGRSPAASRAAAAWGARTRDLQEAPQQQQQPQQQVTAGRLVWTALWETA